MDEIPAVGPESGEVEEVGNSATTTRSVIVQELTTNNQSTTTSQQSTTEPTPTPQLDGSSPQAGEQGGEEDTATMIPVEEPAAPDLEVEPFQSGSSSKRTGVSPLHK